MTTLNSNTSVETGKANGVVVNGAANRSADVTALTDTALLILAASKGQSADTVKAMKLMATNDEIAAKLNGLPDAPIAPPAPAVKSLEEQLAELRAENDRLRAVKASKQVLTCKVSEKKAMSVYGLGQWPVTLYKEQWAKLISEMPKIQAFLRDNDKLLAVKPVK